MMTNRICFIDINQVFIDPRIPQQPTDPADLFFHVHSQLRTPGAVPPIKVRVDSGGNKYLILCDGQAYTNEGLPLEAAQVLGMTNIRCCVIDDDCEYLDDEMPTPSVPIDTLFHHSFPLAPDPVRLESLFRDLFRQVRQMTARAASRVEHTTLRIADESDWLQEAALMLWRELRERDRPRLTSANEVRRYVSVLVRNQAARATALGKRACSLPDFFAGDAGSVLDELITNEQEHRLNQAVVELQSLGDRVEAAIRETLARLSSAEVTAMEAWLEGASCREAAERACLSFGRVRGLTHRLGWGSSDVARLLLKLRGKLEEVYRESPKAAARFRMGLLRRFLVSSQSGSECSPVMREPAQMRRVSR